MRRTDIVREVRSNCIEKYYDHVSDWGHGILHIKRVVECGMKLAREEGLNSKDAFLVELACWLHDIGRAEEENALDWGKSNHAEISYFLSKKVLSKFERTLGRESVFKVYQAVREHSLPRLMHPENNVSRILIDADRGSSLNAIGILRVLSYNDLYQSGPVVTLEEARNLLPKSIEVLKKSGKTLMASEKIEGLLCWFYGTRNKKEESVVVAPLYTQAARRLYKKGTEEIEDYLKLLNTLSV